MQLTEDTNIKTASRRSNQHIQPIDVQVVRHKVIAPNVVTLFLAEPGTRHAPGPYLPGQFITLAFPSNAGTIYRSYSLCGSGNPRVPWQITLKRIPGGLVSNYLYEHVHVGMILHALPPRGSFTLPTSLRPEQTLVFIAVGSGITPIKGFLQAIAALPPGNRPHVQLHYASRSAEEMIFHEEIIKLDWLKQIHYLRTNGPRMTPEWIFANARPLPHNAQWYICGPETFTREMRQALVTVGAPENAIHVELFADQSKQHVAAATSRPIAGHITIHDTETTVDVREQETVLEALERNGYQPEFGCRSGTCGTCQLHLLRGQVCHSGDTFLTKAELTSGLILGCTAQPQGNITIESGGIPPRGTPVVKREVARKPTTQKYPLRLAAASAVGMMILGLWQLTDHKVSASVAKTTTSATSTATSVPTTTSTTTPKVTSTTTSTPTSKATATPTTVPTAKPTATSTPKPTAKTSSS